MDGGGDISPRMSPSLLPLGLPAHTHTPSLFRGPVGFGMRPLSGPPQRPGQDMRDFRDVSGGTKLCRGCSSLAGLYVSGELSWCNS